MILKIKGGMLIFSTILLFQIILFGCLPTTYKVKQNVPDHYFLSNSKVDLKVQLLIKDSMVETSFQHIRAGYGLSITDPFVNGAKQMAESVFSEAAISGDKDVLQGMDAVLIPKLHSCTVREDLWYKEMKMSVAVIWTLMNSSGKVIWFDIVKVTKLAPSTFVAPVAIKRMKSLSIEILGEVFSETANRLKSSKRVLAYIENRYIAQTDLDSVRSKMLTYKAEVTTEEEFKNDNWNWVPSELETGKIAVIGCERREKYSSYELGVVSETTFHLLMNNLKAEYQKCWDISAPEVPILLHLRKGEIEFTTDRQAVIVKNAYGISEHIYSEKKNRTFTYKDDTIFYKLFCTLNFYENILQRSSCE